MWINSPPKIISVLFCTDGSFGNCFGVTHTLLKSKCNIIHHPSRHSIRTGLRKTCFLLGSATGSYFCISVAICGSVSLSVMWRYCHQLPLRTAKEKHAIVDRYKLTQMVNRQIAKRHYKRWINLQLGCFYWGPAGICSLPNAAQYLYQWFGGKTQIVAVKINK